MFFLPALQTSLGLAVAPLWAPLGVADDADSHVALRGAFVSHGEAVSLRMLGASEYLVWVDGKLVADGPARFAKGHPEYQTLKLALSAGSHLLAVHAHNDGVTTRILATMKPFIWFDALEGGQELSIQWKCARITGYRPRTHRISDILGWIDWCDTARDWPKWERPGFNDGNWKEPVSVEPGLGPITEAKIRPVHFVPISLKPTASGKLSEEYGYELDDPAVRFFLRDLNPTKHPAQGVWRRYDLGRIRLGRPTLTLDCPKGAVVEMAECEALRHGRVHAWITLSGSTTCNMDHFVARGGVQEFMPTTPKGGRFLEVHVLSSGPVKFLKEGFLESAYYLEPIGSFECDDPLLNRVWKLGVDTVRSCSEDALVDCPTRERGEWTGDVATVSTDICGVAYDDLSLSRRALVQAAQAARGDGLVAGVGPGDPGYLSTYAAQWVTACVHYWELTGDLSLLKELEPAAERNLAAFKAQTTADGVSDNLGWAFVDWGYVRNEGPRDMALNIHYARALRSMVRWCHALGLANEREYAREADSVEGVVKGWLRGKLAKPGNWQNVDYHHAALALLAGLVSPQEERACIDSIEKHLLTCFPNDPDAPRLSDPSVTNDRLMTPYFCHFAFAALLEHGETDFVLKEYRKCWGWMLAQGVTTCLEVFDTRWSHCHEWSGCPTWQLSRYVLGLQPRFDLGDRVYDVHIQPGSLKHVRGHVPLVGGGAIEVEWNSESDGIHLKIGTPRPIRLRIDGQEVSVAADYSETFRLKHSGV